ncbi:hypothetical protein RvY_18131 [Ramazzottius varieornatus]|uniref:Uncharacterized protein n=1 Tax=Ramazzottius varieornatus TaxID=947166 RepID=A0A1D1W4M9_RAMVA|nr:hypothetical protein RvY_18131 [Ramazzottius varieornatus]
MHWRVYGLYLVMALVLALEVSAKDTAGLKQLLRAKRDGWGGGSYGYRGFGGFGGLGGFGGGFGFPMGGYGYGYRRGD